jgi:hypothetical protein
MKKLFMFVALAAMCVVANAQQLKTFDGKLFSCQYPAEFEAQEQWMDDAFNAKIEDGVEFFSLSVADQDMDADQLKMWAEGMKGLIEKSFGEPTGWKAGAPVIKGKIVTLRAEGEEDPACDDNKIPTVKYTFCTVTPDKKTFCGELKFQKKDEAKYKPLVDKIIASCKAK